MDNMIPDEFRALAITHKNDLFWTYHVILAVIEHLSHNKNAVVGVELFQKMPDAVKWIASSNYHVDESLEWEVFVAACRDGARDFVEANKDYEKTGLFSAVWIAEVDRGSPSC